MKGISYTGHFHNLLKGPPANQDKPVCKSTLNMRNFLAVNISITFDPVVNSAYDPYL